MRSALEHFEILLSDPYYTLSSSRSLFFIIERRVSSMISSCICMCLDPVTSLRKFMENVGFLLLLLHKCSL